MGNEAANVVVGKVVDLLFGVAIKEIGYIRNCSENVKKFKNDAENLKHMRERVQQQIDSAKKKGDRLLYGAQEWVKKADIEISKAENFLEEEANAKKTCFKLGFCSNWGTLYHYGKMSTKKLPSLLQHQKLGMAYETCVSVDTPTPGRLDVYQNKNLDVIDTLKSALGDIMNAIRDESKQIIGIYGEGGVGKTTLAMEVAARVKNQFAAVAFTAVSQNVDVEKIKKDIEEATKRILQGEKILIILDDVWEGLDLEELRIPCGINYMNCKILLTSRNIRVCEVMNAQSKICVASLRPEEAWILFKRYVGESVENNVNLKQVAVQVVEECGGLPLFIKAVGNALKNKSIHLWNSALAQLKKHAPSNIDPEISKALTRLKLSYDYLESEEARSCFLLCSMFPEDAYISLEVLAYYGVGLGKFNNLDSIEDARDRVLNAVDILTSSGLLLNVDNKRETKMHDVVRDVALLIASEGKNKYLVEAGKGLTEWMPRTDISKGYTGISLMKNKICKLPDYELHFPLLDTFLIQKNFHLSKISDEFIKGIKEAKVLDMEDNNISTLPKSMNLLIKLRMLNLDRNTSLQEISILGELEKLEILILNGTSIKEIPKEIGKLVNLRRFEVKGCEGLTRIAPGVISNLRWLEELCISYYQMQSVGYNSLEELGHLSRLKYLYLFVTHYGFIPVNVNFGLVEKFMIEIGYIASFRRMFPLRGPSKRSLALANDLPDIQLFVKLKELIQVSDAICLQSMSNLNNIVPNVYYEGSNDLKSIAMIECDTGSSLVDTKYWEKMPEDKFLSRLEHLFVLYQEKLEVLWKCPDQYISLSKLVTLVLSTCPNLVRVLSVSVAQELVNLQVLSIMCCDRLEEVIRNGDEEDTSRGETETIVAHQDANICFPSLTQINLLEMKKLKCFSSGSSNIEYPSLVNVRISDCPELKIWGLGVHDTPELKFINEKPLDGNHDLNDVVFKLSKEPKWLLIQ